MSDFPGAIADADQATQTDDQDATFWNAACWARAVANTDLPTARTDCERAIAIGGDAAWGAYDSRALVRFRTGDFAGAVADETEAMKHSPPVAGSLLVLGYAEAGEGAAQQGADDVRKAMQVDPKVAESYAHWGVVAPVAGHTQQTP